MPGMRGLVRKVWAWWTNSPQPPAAPAASPPHVAVFRTPAGFDATRIKIDDYRGLLYVESLGRGATRDGRLLTVWRDRAAYRATAPRFNAGSGLTPLRPPWQGFHLGTRAIKPPRLKRLLIWLPYAWAVLATLVAVLDYPDKFVDRFGPPTVEASIESAPIDVLVGDPVKFKVGVRNTRAIGECFVAFTSQSVSPPNGIALKSVGAHSVPGVKPDDIASVPVEGTAIGPGLYTISIEGRATAGLLRQQQPFKLEPQVRIWPALEVTEGRVKELLDGSKACKAEFQMRPGREFARGVAMEALLEHVPRVRFRFVLYPEFASRDAPSENWGTPGQEIAKAAWKTGELKAMRPKSFWIVLVGDQARNRDEWELVVRSVRFVLKPIL